MKRLLFGFLVGLTLGTLASAQEGPAENSLDRLFGDGGSVRLKFSSGDYTVRAGSSDHVRVQWQAPEPSYERYLRKIKVLADAAGSVMTIKTDGPTKHARFVIEIPVHSDLYLRMR